MSFKPVVASVPDEKVIQKIQDIKKNIQTSYFKQEIEIAKLLGKKYQNTSSTISGYLLWTIIISDIFKHYLQADFDTKKAALALVIRDLYYKYGDATNDRKTWTAQQNGRQKPSVFPPQLDILKENSEDFLSPNMIKLSDVVKIQYLSWMNRENALSCLNDMADPKTQASAKVLLNRHIPLKLKKTYGPLFSLFTQFQQENKLCNETIKFVKAQQWYALGIEKKTTDPGSFYASNISSISSSSSLSAAPEQSDNDFLGGDMFDDQQVINNNFDTATVDDDLIKDFYRMIAQQQLKNINDVQYLLEKRFLQKTNWMQQDFTDLSGLSYEKITEVIQSLQVSRFADVFYKTLLTKWITVNMEKLPTLRDIIERRRNQSLSAVDDDHDDNIQSSQPNILRTPVRSSSVPQPQKAKKIFSSPYGRQRIPILKEETENPDFYNELQETLKSRADHVRTVIDDIMTFFYTVKSETSSDISYIGKYQAFSQLDWFTSKDRAPFLEKYKGVTSVTKKMKDEEANLLKTYVTETHLLEYDRMMVSDVFQRRELEIFKVVAMPLKELLNVDINVEYKARSQTYEVNVRNFIRSINDIISSKGSIVVPDIIENYDFVCKVAAYNAACMVFRYLMQLRAVYQWYRYNIGLLQSHTYTDLAEFFSTTYGMDTKLKEIEDRLNRYVLDLNLSKILMDKKDQKKHGFNDTTNHSSMIAAMKKKQEDDRHESVFTKLKLDEFQNILEYNNF